MKSEAIQFLEINKVDKLWHECILNVAGRIPLLLSLFRKVQSSESLGESQSSMLRLVDSIVDDLACAQKSTDEQYRRTIPLTLTWMARAARGDLVHEKELTDYKNSYVAQERLTYL